MNQSTTIYYTAAQLARALGRQRQALARPLAAMPADGRVIDAVVTGGHIVPAWSYAALPAKLRVEIEQGAQRLKFKDGPALLNAPASTAPAPAFIPLADVAQPSLDKAVKLQRALAGYLTRQHEPLLSAGELEAIGLTHYAREFGHTISARHLRGLVKRTVDRARAAGVQTFERLDLFLEQNPARKIPLTPIISLAVESEFKPLHDAIRQFTNPAAPSLAEKSYLWLRAFELYEEKLATAPAPKTLKRALLKFLERNAPFLVSAAAVSVANQIRVNFHRRHAAWIGSDRDAKSQIDNRAEKSGRFRRPPFPDADRDKFIAHAVHNCGGRVAQAWRELLERREFSEPILGYYLANPSRKSYVPDAILESVKYEVAMLEDIHHGPRQAKLNGAHLFRDWSGVHSLDWFQGDDFTYPIYFKTTDENGATVLMRGQTLLMIDLRTTRILGFVLIPERNYTANAIRTLITNIADVYGLPRKGFYFEQGTWEAKLLTGDKAAESLSWPETRMGLTEFGLKFHHAELPRAKPVERVGGALQNIMEGLPFYVGRNEIVEKFERTQKSLERARKGDASALAQIMDHAEWCEVLERLCELYNADKQDGKMTGGLSPNEAFEKFANPADPPVKFSGECRYLLAHQRRAVRVTENGITFRINKEVFNYRNTDTSKLRGQTVLTWFNPELPEILTVTNMDRKNPFTIVRTQEVPAMDAPADLLAQEMERIAQHQSYPKARYKILKPLRPLAFRAVVADRETVELGAQIGAQRSAALHQTTVADTRKRRVQARARELEIPAAIVNTDPDADEGMAIMLESKRAHQKNQRAAAVENQPD